MSVKHLNNESFDEAIHEKGKTVLVDFWAEWCGPCMMLSPIVEEVSDEVDDVKFCSVNCDVAREIALDFNIMTIPNLLLFENGELINQSVGYIEKDELIAFVNSKK